MVDAHSIKQHNVFVRDLSHHAGGFKESLLIEKQAWLSACSRPLLSVRCIDNCQGNYTVLKWSLDKACFWLWECVFCSVRGCVHPECWLESMESVQSLHTPYYNPHEHRSGRRLPLLAVSLFQTNSFSYFGFVDTHQWDIPMSRAQHLQNHLDLLEGCVTGIFVLLTLHLQGAWVDVCFCAGSKMLFLVGRSKKKETVFMKKLQQHAGFNWQNTRTLTGAA